MTKGILKDAEVGDKFYSVDNKTWTVIAVDERDDRLPYKLKADGSAQVWWYSVDGDEGGHGLNIPFGHKIASKRIQLKDYKKKDKDMMLPIRSVAEQGKKFVVIDTSTQNTVGSYETLELAQSAAKRALKQDSEFYIFQAVSRVAPKPIDADIEEL